ncbi:MAG TPA: SPFH domain-containing protein [Nocardioidaceae bacterium]|nr:SPFH domain-containing protein [Nocardioidaceae bacterium]
MAAIQRYPFVRHLSSTATAYVQLQRNGRPVHAGAGRAFWFRPLDAVLSEVPVDDRELPMVLHCRTVDLQDVTAQGTLTFRITDPAAMAARIDFGIDVVHGQWHGTPLEQLASLLVESAQQQALGYVAGLRLVDAVVSAERVRAAVADGLASDQRLTEMGVAVLGVRIMAVRAEPEFERAMQTPARELIQQEADRATFERRALAVENEAAIGENELANQIELARRQEQLVAQRGANALREAEEAAAAARVATAAEAERLMAIGDAKAHAEAAALAAYRDLPEAVLLGLALKELAANLPHIESVVLTPDLLAPVLARLGRTP